MAIKSRIITSSEKQMLVDIKPEQIDIDLLNKLFASTLKGGRTGKISPPMFNTYDEFSLKKGEYFNKEDITTNCGLFVLNKYLFERDLSHVTGYINFPLDKKGVGKVDEMLSQSLMEDKISPTQYATYLNRLCNAAFTFNTQVCASFTLRSLKPIPAVEKRKKELLSLYAEEIKNKDIPTVIKMERELVTLAEKELQGDSSMELYKSGARGAFDNAYKNSMIMKGPVFNSAKNEWDIMTNGLSQGIAKSDIATSANSVIAGVYPKAIGTAECGYLSKQLSAAFQSRVLGPRGSDCGSKGYETLKLTNDNKGYLMYMYIVEGKDLVLLTPDNESKYIGKQIKLRTPLYCTSKELCSKCAGERYYMLDIQNIGLTSSKVSNSMLNARMKKFHNSTVKTFVLNPEEVFL